MITKLQKAILLSIILLAVIVPKKCLVLSECTCDPADDGSENDKSEALKYKLIAIAAILVAGAFGVCLPIVGKRIPSLRPERDGFFIVKAFAAGVILATGFIHVLPDAFESLTSPCLPENPWGNFPFTGFIAMMAAMCTLMVDTYATSYYSSISSKSSAVDAVHDDVEVAQQIHAHTHATHGHSHGPVTDSTQSDLIRHRVISQVTTFDLVFMIRSINLLFNSLQQKTKQLIELDCRCWNWE